jgi:hypothetical protein
MPARGVNVRAAVPFQLLHADPPHGSASMKNS